MQPSEVNAVVLADHAEKVWRYAISFEAVRPPDVWRLVLAKTGTDEVYRVTLDARGWRCNCKAFEYSKEAPKACKHCLAAGELRGIIEASNAANREEAAPRELVAVGANGKDQWPHF